MSDFKQRMSASVELKAERVDIQQAIAAVNSEQTQKGFELRQELFKKITDIQGKYNLLMYRTGVWQHR